jgi:hypothetical protein
LVPTLEELAVEVGGAALFRFRCDQLSGGSAESSETTRFECSANVLANKAESRRFGPPEHRAGLLATANVEFDGVGPLGEPWPSAIDVPVQPIAERRIGTLTITLNEGGTVDAARLALLQAAASLGATHAIAPACHLMHHSNRWSCFAVITTPELDPRREPSAR